MAPESKLLIPLPHGLQETMATQLRCEWPQFNISFHIQPSILNFRDISKTLKLVHFTSQKTREYKVKDLSHPEALL